MATIHSWDQAETAFVMMRADSLGRCPVYSIDLTSMGADQPIKRDTSDPEAAAVLRGSEAFALTEVVKLAYVPVPYNVAAKMVDLDDVLVSTRSTCQSYQAMIADAALPVEGCEAETFAKLTIDTVDVSSHEGAGSASYLTLQDGYVVVTQDWFDEKSTQFSE